ncbi:MAG: hypothetical protein J5995_10480 [Muribaculaceae bacterium]|nr:hypothetical protein [Muribaculaceae bacterium]
MAWSEAMDLEADAASVEVNIDNYEFAAPQNLKVSFEEQSNGKYTVLGSWDAPEGDMTPVNYVVYVNGKSIGWIDAGEELSLGQSGLYKGVYTFEVEACYQFPEGVSKRISASVFPGTVPAPVSLVLSDTDGGVNLTWDIAEVEGANADHFRIFRGDELLADDVKVTEYRDEEAPEGTCTYSVHAVYADGAVSLPAVVEYTAEEVKALSIPVTENFDNGHLPAGWRVELLDPYDKVKDMYSWRFDNWFENVLPDESGINGGFASVDGFAAGMNRLESYLRTPSISLPADEEASVRFTKYFYEEKPGPSGPAGFIVEVSPAEFDSFETLADLCALENGEVSISLANFKGRDIVLRWGFISRFSGFAAIDNVRIEKGSSVSSLPVAGEVFDVFSPDGKAVGLKVAKPFMQTLPDGIYILRSADGSTQKYLKK